MCLEYYLPLEHRCAVRYPVELPVLLRSPSRGVMAATLVNISAGGACIALSGRPMTSSHLVELLMTGPQGPASWPALVIHRREQFYGLMFDRQHTAELDFLVRAGALHRVKAQAA